MDAKCELPKMELRTLAREINSNDNKNENGKLNEKFHFAQTESDSTSKLMLIFLFYFILRFQTLSLFLHRFLEIIDYTSMEFLLRSLSKLKYVKETLFFSLSFLTLKFILLKSRHSCTAVYERPECI